MKVSVKRARISGFTLIELLIAMSLTVLIGAVAYRFLDAAIRVQQQGEVAQQSLTALEQTWQLLAADLLDSIDRPVVRPATGTDFLSGIVSPDTGGSGEARRPSMMSAQVSNTSLSQLLSRDGALLWFSRQGWQNPLGQQRSELQRILYRLDNNGDFYRDYWPERNQALSDAPEASVLLLENVQRAEFTYLPAGQLPQDGAWLAQWPVAPVPTAADDDDDISSLPLRGLPAAVRVVLEFANTGNNAVVAGGGLIVERTFLLAGF